MTIRPKKAIIIGLDGASADLVKKFMNEGIMPNLLKLKKKGVFAKAMPTIPTHTPTNWTTISTGAWPGTHGITGFSILTRGESYMSEKSGFDTRNVKAEFLWQAAERYGKKCILLKWAGPQFPVTVKNGIQVDGCFCVWCIHEISGPRLYSTLDEEYSTKIKIKKAEGWVNLPSSFSPPLETEIILGSDKLKCKVYLLIIDSKGSGYDKVLITTIKDGSKVLDTLTEKSWSKWLFLNFKGEKNVKGTVRLKLVSLSKDGMKLRIYCSQIMPVRGWSYPDNISEELVKNVGPFLQRVGYVQEGEVYGAWVDHETFLEELRYQHEWFAKAAIYLMKKYEWDLFFLHSHAPDYVLDNAIRLAEPLTSPNKETSNRFLNIVREVFGMIDEMIGKIVNKVATEDTLIVIVSDHGLIGYHGRKSITEVIRDILVKKGYLVYKKKEELGPATKPRRVKELIDWSKTKAIVHDDVYIYLNVKGREPHGIVNPEEYEKVREDIIKTLLEYEDPLLKSCPFSLILRAEDAEIIGLRGNRIGDIIFTVRPGGLYNEGHGIYLPTAKFGMSSLYAFLLMTGPGLKKDYELKRPIWLVDVAPTIAFLLGFPPPRNSEGAIIFEAFSEDFINYIFNKLGG